MAIGSFALVLFLATAAGLSNGLAAGLMAGGLTSTPTLVGAQNAVYSGLAELGEAITADDLVQSISVGYAITYIFGTVGLLLVVKLLPGLLGIDLAAEARRFAQERGFVDGSSRVTVERPILRAYRIEGKGLEGQTLAQIVAESSREDASVQTIFRIKRGSELIDPKPETLLEAGDKVAFFGTPQEHLAVRERLDLGYEVLDEDLIDAVIDVAEVIVTHDDAVGRSLGEIGIYAEHGCFVSRITRSQIEMPLTANTRLQRGDVVTISGEREALAALVDRLGAEEGQAVETDLLTFATGIVVGLFIGQITIKVGGIDVGIGNAGGLLLSGIAVGFLRANRPTFGQMPAAARFILMELGLLLFMVGVGLNAGSGIVDALGSVGPTLFLCGVAVTCLPLLLGYAFGRLVLRMSPAVLLGALTGAMTSTPALGIVQQAAKSSVPSLGYAGTYALANVLLTVAGTILMIL